jgi:lysozyme
VCLLAYDDGVGVLTIGVGHTNLAGPPKVTSGMRISLDEAIRIFRADIAAVERDVLSLVKVPLHQHQFDALVSLTLNIGSDIDADTKAEGLGDSTLLKLLNKGDYQGAADAILSWKNAGGKPILLKRRERERLMFLNANYGDVSKVPVYEGDPRRTKPKLMPFPDAAPAPPDKPLRPIPDATTITHRDVKKTRGQAIGLAAIIAAILGIASKLLGLW